MLDIPFVRSGDFWVVSPVGDWLQDSDTGRAYGNAYLERLAAGGDAPEFGWVIASMIEYGRFTGVEAGFCGAIARALASGRADGVETLRAAIRAQHDADNLELQCPIGELDGALLHAPSVGDEQGWSQELTQQQDVQCAHADDDDIAVGSAGDGGRRGVDGNDIA